MSQITHSLPRKSLREFSYLMLAAAMLLLAGCIIALAVWFLRAQPVEMLNAGSVSDYPPQIAPYHVSAPGVQTLDVDGNPRTNNRLWIMNFDGELIAFAALARDSIYFAHCAFAWNGANERFENPCSGSKHLRNGIVIDGPAKYDLDRYPIELVAGELIIDTSTLIPGACRDLSEGYQHYLRHDYWSYDALPCSW